MSKTAPLSSVEALESRIAPALLVVGANLLGGENPKTGEGSLGADSVTMIKVLSGTAIAWYDGLHITSVSFGPNTTLDLTGDVGELIGNLMPNGRLSDSDGNSANGEDGNVLLPNNLLGVTTHALSEHLGDIGTIITGGAVSNVNVHGHLNGIYAGDGAFRTDSAVLSGGEVHVDVSGNIAGFGAIPLKVNPLDPNSDTGFTFTQATSKLAPGASISKLNVAIAQEMQVFAGDGGLGLPASPGYAAIPANPKGGSISTVKITSAFISEGSDSSTPSYWLYAGDGANGIAGGAGGSIIGILEETSNNLVTMQAGKGGNGTSGPGGAGGNVQGLDLQSDSSAYTINGGNGGHGGGGGGAGGSVTLANFSGKKPNSGVILAADFNGDGYEDVLVADSNTGDMVIAAGSATGLFTNIVQYVKPITFENVVTIENAGSTPSSAVAVDADGDGDLDIVVAYKNSSSLGVFVNNGNGTFYDSVKEVFQSSTIKLTYSPEKLLVGNFGGTSAQDLAIIENDQGHAKVQVATGDGAGKFSPIEKFSVFSSVITAAASTHSVGLDTIFVANTSGSIYALAATGSPDSPLSTPQPAAAIPGGVATMDVNSTSTELVAVAANGAAVNVYGIALGGALIQTAALDLSAVSGRPATAHFIANQGTDALNSIVLLSVAGSGSQLSLFTAMDADTDPNTIDTTYSIGQQLNSTSALKNFVPVYNYAASGDVSGFGVAALSGSLSQFTFSPALSGSSDFALPFTGKSVTVKAGDGGAGDGSGKGGIGGSVFAINADATVVVVGSGAGGNSDHSTGGKGGSISNPGSFITLSGVVVVPSLKADTTLQLTSGIGGSVLQDPGAGAKGGAGGAGGAISNLTLFLAHNELDITTGGGGTGRGLAGGSGGAVSAITAANGDGGIKIQTGTGGDAKIGNFAAGNGGAISGVKFSLAVAGDDAEHEEALTVAFLTGGGGTSTSGLGGSGGALSSVSVKLNGGDVSYDDPKSDPPKSDTHIDSTISVLFQTGMGGDGTIGGAGGNVTAVTSQSTFDQVSTDNVLRLNPVVLTIAAGGGGKGSTGAGGAGGAIALKGAAPIAGITNYDKDSSSLGTLPLSVTSGDGGAGKTKGGAGGAISGLVVQNARYGANMVLTPTQLAGAAISSGQGGSGDLEGGKGGDISGLQVGTQYGALLTTAGAGGTGAKGGQGGGVSSSTLATVGGALFTVGGTGGQGVSLGGKGGALSKLTINAPQFDQDGYVGFFAGEGGAATGQGGFGGEGGSISGITQLKDINSAIDIIEAGDGGAATLGTGGKGGSVSGVKTVGFIGRPSDGVTKLGAFDSAGDPQGLFSGRGGAGSTKGTAGGVTGVVARQIAAISAAYDVTSQTFAIASIVSGVKADVIGYDIGTPGVFDSVTSPSTTKPVDGFILAATTSGLTTQTTPQFVFSA